MTFGRGDLIDLSPLASPATAVWPGDTPLTREVLASLAEGSSVDLSTLHSTVHLGTHTDSWSHVVEGSETIDRMPLDAYVGPCQVVHVEVGRNELVTPDHLPDLLEAPRLLVATGTFPDPDEFNTDFAAFDPDTPRWLAEHGGRLLGTDAPSVDVFSSRDLPTHHTCVERRLAILEGLVLAGVPDGVYELIALPLRLAGFDASPVRAVLRVP
ncbi:MAG: kynurenine formamidase [Actinomycetia bacterium]|nr:kynurenine formamidase [Actinomycetes bacterium]MCP4959854.1 kynurenine formamidase [Actinomycetes bacterium]